MDIFETSNIKSTLTQISEWGNSIQDITQEDLTFLQNLTSVFLEEIANSTHNEALSDSVFYLYRKTLFSIKWLNLNITSETLDFILQTSASELYKNITDTKNISDNYIWEQIFQHNDSIANIFTQSFESTQDNLNNILPDYNKLIEKISCDQNGEQEDMQLFSEINDKILMIDSVSTQFLCCIATLIYADGVIDPSEKKIFSMYREKLPQDIKHSFLVEDISMYAYSMRELPNIFSMMKRSDKLKLLWASIYTAMIDGDFHANEKKFILLLIKDLWIQDKNLMLAIKWIQTISHQKAVIEQLHEDENAAKRYASRIQNAVLPSDKEIKDVFPDSFLVYKPKDVVSWDFYLVKKFERYDVAIVADSTGHGVPWAFVSIFGWTSLVEIINKLNQENNLTAATVLNELRQKVKKAFMNNHTGEQWQDGMDMTICLVDKENMMMNYAWWHNKLIEITDWELVEHKVDKMPIWAAFRRDQNAFTDNNITINDCQWKNNEKSSIKPLRNGVVIWSKQMT